MRLCSPGAQIPPQIGLYIGVFEAILSHLRPPEAKRGPFGGLGGQKVLRYPLI